MIKKCKNCNKQFSTNNKRKVFCSSGCMRYYHSRKSALKLITERHEDNKECVICEQNEYPINVIHHVKRRCDGGKGSTNNLITVCPNCHTMIHKKIIIFEERKHNAV